MKKTLVVEFSDGTQEAYKTGEDFEFPSSGQEWIYVHFDDGSIAISLAKVKWLSLFYADDD